MPKNDSGTRCTTRGGGSALLLWLLRDGQHPADALLQRDERLGSSHTLDVLYQVVHQVHQVLVVASIHLDHHRVVTRGEVALHNLAYLLQLGNNLTI